MEAADLTLEKGILMFHMMVTPDQMARDDFINILTCFRCYAMESHPTKTAEKPKSYVQSVGKKDRWSECRNPIKKCLNCDK